MPRIQSIHEVTKLDIYDEMFSQFGALNYMSYARMFNNRNVGVLEMSNLDFGGCFTEDKYAVVTGWRARTNIPACRELDEWANATSVGLMIGERPAWRSNVYEMLRRGENSDAEIDSAAKTRAEAGAALARLLYKQFGNDAVDWYKVGEVAHAHFHYKPRLVIPVRQNYGVAVDTSLDALRALVRLSEGKSQPRVWVHIEGFLKRSIQ